MLLAQREAIAKLQRQLAEQRAASSLLQAQVRDPIMEAGLGLQLPVLALHLLGGLFGYVVPKTMGFEESIARTMAMEVSPLNEGVGQQDVQQPIQQRD